MPTGVRRRASLGNRIGMMVIALVVGILVVVMLMQSSGLKKRIRYYQHMNESLEQSIAEERGRAEELKTLPEYIRSDEFVEKTAREKFGLVYDNEIIFKAEEP